MGARTALIRIDPARAVEGLFATITYRLEPGGRGSRYPMVMNRLYSGRLDPAEAPAALRELAEIETGLLALAPHHVVWSFTDLRRLDDRTFPVNHAALNVRDYFVTTDGRPLLQALRDAVLLGQDRKEALELATRESAGNAGAAWTLLAGGFLWTIIGYLLFPNWVFTSIYEHSEHKGGLLIWPAGLVAFAAGMVGLITMRYPAIGEWFQRKAWFTVALLLVVGMYVWLASRG